MAMPALQEAYGQIKKALDPNGVLSPGKYGIRAVDGTAIK